MEVSENNQPQASRDLFERLGKEFSMVSAAIKTVQSVRRELQEARDGHIQLSEDEVGIKFKEAQKALRQLAPYIDGLDLNDNSTTVEDTCEELLVNCYIATLGTPISSISADEVELAKSAAAHALKDLDLAVKEICTTLDSEQKEQFHSDIYESDEVRALARLETSRIDLDLLVTTDFLGARHYCSTYLRQALRDTSPRPEIKVLEDLVHQLAYELEDSINDFRAASNFRRLASDLDSKLDSKLSADKAAEAIAAAPMPSFVDSDLVKSIVQDAVSVSAKQAANSEKLNKLIEKDFELNAKSFWERKWGEKKANDSELKATRITAQELTEEFGRLKAKFKENFMVPLETRGYLDEEGQVLKERVFIAKNIQGPLSEAIMELFDGATSLEALLDKFSLAESFQAFSQCKFGISAGLKNSLKLSEQIELFDQEISGLKKRLENNVDDSAKTDPTLALAKALVARHLAQFSLETSSIYVRYLRAINSALDEKLGYPVSADEDPTLWKGVAIALGRITNSEIPAAFINSLSSPVAMVPLEHDQVEDFDKSGKSGILLNRSVKFADPANPDSTFEAEALRKMFPVFVADSIIAARGDQSEPVSDELIVRFAVFLGPDAKLPDRKLVGRFSDAYENHCASVAMELLTNRFTLESTRRMVFLSDLQVVLFDPNKVPSSLES